MRKRMEQRLPVWFKQEVPRAGETAGVERLLKDLNLHTVCDGAHCPNKGYCFSHGTATFLIMGDTCTRNCTFCAIDRGNPSPLDEHEPSKVAEAVKRLGLSYVVITSVTRDDLPDGGATHFARTVECVHQIRPRVKVEVLVPDFKGVLSSIKAVLKARPEVFAYNLETVSRLYFEVRPMAGYKRSLEVLRQAKEISAGVVTKSALMLGLGETQDEVVSVMHDLREVGCDLFTLGQYLAPPRRYPVVRFLSPDEFTEYERIALKAGFSTVASAPLVRSSYRAAELFSRAMEKQPAAGRSITARGN